MRARTLPSNRRTVGPYCRALQRGVLGDTISGTSREGKFLRRVEAELTQHVGGCPSFPQTLLIRRVSRAMLRLELMDSKLDGPDWTDHDGRVFGGLSTAFGSCCANSVLSLRPPRN
jgi:hypothetical protein